MGDGLLSHGYVAGDACGAVRSSLVVVFGAVMSDAAMLDAVLKMDVWGQERDEGERRG